MRHSLMTGAQIHVPFAYEYADATAREAATGFVAGDVGKFAHQLDNHTIWMLTDNSPETWVFVSLDIESLTEELTPTTGDMFVMSRSGVLYKVDADNLPGGGGGGGGRTLISSQTPSGVSSVTFSSIAGTYSKLILEILARSTNAANGVDAHLQFNSDTTSGNYVYELPRWNASGSANDVGINYKIATTTIPGSAAPSNEFATGKVEMIGYANSTTNKKALAHWAAQYDNSAVYLQSQVGAMTWVNTAAITDIVFALSAGNFVSGSVVNLYGE